MENKQTARSVELGPWAIGREALEAYLEAVQDSSTIYEELDLVPPPTVAAFVLREYLRNEQLPAGTIQTIQQLQSMRPVRIDEELRCDLWLSFLPEEDGWTPVSAVFIVQDREREIVLKGRTVVLVPSGQAP